MNHDSVNEYISWLEYIDHNKELRDIFAGTLEKFHKILSGYSVDTEEDIIRSLKELVRKVSYL